MKKFHFCLFIAVPVLAASYSVSAGDPKMKIFKNAQEMELDPFGKGGNAFLTDVVTSTGDPGAPVTCGLFRMEKGESLKYTYTYNEAKILLEGEMTVSDGSSTQKVKPGDALYFPKGATITFSSDNSGLGWYCGARKTEDL